MKVVLTILSGGILYGGAALALLGGTAGSPASPLARVLRRDNMDLGPFSYLSETRVFKGRERASIVLYGKTGRASYLAVYVFDRQGNCLTWDDVGSSSTRDDVAVEWYPPQSQPYSYEIRNLGFQRTPFEMAIR